MEHLYLRVSNSVSLRNAHYFIQCRLNCASTGNLSSKGTTTYGYNDTTHDHAVTQVGSNTYGYDANGNMTTRTVGGQTYTLGYDAEGHLVSVSGATTATFVYDGDGQRVISTIGTTTTGFVGDHTEWVVGAANQPTRYYNAGGLRLATRAAGVMYYPLTDHLGSTTMTTDASGYSTAEIRYKAWGETRYTYGTQQTKHTYTGQYSNVSDFGLMYYNARWYDPLLSRFSSGDSIVPISSQGVQGWDRYAYTNNNPMRYVDPTGHKACDEVGENGKCIAYESNEDVYVKGFTREDFASVWESQGDTNNCGSYSLKFVLALQEGVNLSGEEVDGILVKNGKKIPGMGIPGRALANGAELFGLDAEYIKNGNIEMLIEQANQGNLVVVGVSWQTTSEILKLALITNPANEMLKGITVGHWLVVAGYNEAEEKIILLDPGSNNPEEKFTNYSYAELMEFWTQRRNLFIGSGDTIIFNYGE